MSDQNEKTYTGVGDLYKERKVINYDGKAEQRHGELASGTLLKVSIISQFPY